MDIQIKNYADNRNLKELKYIFVDALDVDPTFVRYEEEYNYCKAIPGLLEPHIELTPFIKDKNRWDETYWTNLKTDLIKNFSDHRMMHMKEVAQVFLAEKIQRILSERRAASVTPTTATPTVKPSTVQESKNRVVQPTTLKSDTISKEEQQKREIEAERQRLEEENRKALEAERANAERIKRQQQLHNSAPQYGQTGTSSKKVIGIAVAALAVAAVVLILILK